jgi:hypothetical protein
MKKTFAPNAAADFPGNEADDQSSFYDQVSKIGDTQKVKGVAHESDENSAQKRH